MMAGVVREVARLAHGAQQMGFNILWDMGQVGCGEHDQ
jgi:hypothetical protein